MEVGPYSSSVFHAHFLMPFKGNIMGKLSVFFFFLMALFNDIKPISADKVLSRTLRSHKLVSWKMQEFCC